MNKVTKIIIAIVVVIVLAIAVVFLLPNSTHNEVTNKVENDTNIGASTTPSVSEFKVETVDDLMSLVDKLYENIEPDLLPTIETREVDVSDNDMISMLTGLDDGKDFGFLVVSEPIMNDKAYSLVLGKVKDNQDANDIAKKMCDKADLRRWGNMGAEKLYAVNSGDIVLMVMADMDMAGKIYDNFKTVVGDIDDGYTKEAEAIEMPEDMN